MIRDSLVWTGFFLLLIICLAALTHQYQKAQRILGKMECIIYPESESMTNAMNIYEVQTHNGVVIVPAWSRYQAAQRLTRYLPDLMVIDVERVNQMEERTMRAHVETWQLNDPAYPQTRP